MTFVIEKQWTFDAAHRLPLHDGKCSQPHGHTYRVCVAVTADTLIENGPKSGMVLDFGDLSTWWKQQMEPLLDHQDLNETLAPHVRNTTAEEIARFIHESATRAGLPVAEVTVWETPTSRATYTA